MDVNYDAVTLEDVKILFYEGKRLVINDGHIVEIRKEA